MYVIKWASAGAVIPKDQYVRINPGFKPFACTFDDPGIKKWLYREECFDFWNKFHSQYNFECIQEIEVITFIIDDNVE